MEIITHEAKVVAISPNKITVAILRNDACHNCLAKNICMPDENSKQLIEIYSNSSSLYQIGEMVNISIKSSLGLRAVFFAYIIPTILSLTTLFVLKIFNFNDLISCISAIIILIPYYFGLFLNKNKISDKLQFNITKK